MNSLVVVKVTMKVGDREDYPVRAKESSRATVVDGETG